MLHVVKLIERRFPGQAGSLIPVLVILSALALVAGIYLAVR